MDETINFGSTWNERYEFSIRIKVSYTWLYERITTYKLDAAQNKHHT